MHGIHCRSGSESQVKQSNKSEFLPRYCVMQRLCVILVCLCLLVQLPKESEAVPQAWFIAVAARAGVRYLIKNSYYARCNTRYVPAGMNCLPVTYGIGFSRNPAQNAARLYAEAFGDAGCGRYVGHCQIYRWSGGRTRVRGKALWMPCKWS